jgi:hypothetical protein
MPHATPPAAPSAGPMVSRETLDESRRAVRALLAQSPAFARLSQAQQKQMAHDLVQVGAFMAEPGQRIAPEQTAPEVQALASTGLLNLRANRGQASSTSSGEQPKDIGADDAPAFGQAVRTGVEQAVAMIQGVNFPGFVSGLINGVFHSIVTSSIEQMEAYAKLVADVSKSLNQFRDDNTTANQGRDHLLEKFPDLFELQEPGQGGDFSFGDEAAGSSPRVVLRGDVDERQAIARINGSGLALSQPITKLDDELVESLLVPAARTTIATGRQQLLATMVMMGVQRIVVTDGKISAKVLFDFQARDNRRFQKSAVKYDYATDMYGNVQRTHSSEGQWDYKREGGSSTRNDSGVETQRTDASTYSTGTYKYDQTPIVTLMSTSQLRDDSSLQTKASLAGHVEVNFKSDYLPLEKMADPAAIAAIQMNAQPGMVKTMAGRPAPAPGAAASAPAPTAAAPVQAPAPAPAA